MASVVSRLVTRFLGIGSEAFRLSACSWPVSMLSSMVLLEPNITWDMGCSPGPPLACGDRISALCSMFSSRSSFMGMIQRPNTFWHHCLTVNQDADVLWWPGFCDYPQLAVTLILDNEEYSTGFRGHYNSRAHRVCAVHHTLFSNHLLDSCPQDPEIA